MKSVDELVDQFVVLAALLVDAAQDSLQLVLSLALRGFESISTQLLALRIDAHHGEAATFRPIAAFKDPLVVVALREELAAGDLLLCRLLSFFGVLRQALLDDLIVV